ncbi:MAG: HAD family phosphatase [Thermoplasmata archaeon]|nr:HAD family phosphatase [Thermoplasmata archaeon]
MAEISLLLWDVGGVLLSNGWDHSARTAAVERFGLDPVEFERRHQLLDADFEAGRIDWHQYLAATVFDVPRDFTPDEFRTFVEGRSTPNAANLALARSLRARGAWTMAALNNESRELNEFRIAKFGLADVFGSFFSSCYTGHRKPEPAAFRTALGILHRTPTEAVFVDDRPENVAAARQLGLHAILARDPTQLRNDLADAGVAVE